MKLIVGLGNPGLEYKNTKHNVGFMVLDKYAEEKNISFETTKFGGQIIEYKLDKEKVIFLKPQEYMNLSGNAIRKVINYYKINIDDIIVIYDDMDIIFGSYKIKKDGSSAGHNGIKSIIENLGTDNFKRIKIGIGRNKEREMKNYVLSKFSKDEEKIMSETISKVSSLIDEYIKLDFEKFMSRYN